MARTTTVDSPIRKTIITKQDIEEEAPQAVAPPSNGDTENIFTAIAEITAEEWEKTAYVYVNSRDPYRRGQDGVKYLEKVVHPIDPEWLKMNYGGGDYRLLAFRADPITGKTKLWRAGNYTIVGAVHEPAAKVAPAGAQPDAVATLVAALKDALGQGKSVDDAVKVSMDMMGNAYKTALGTIAEGKAAQSNDNGYGRDPLMNQLMTAAITRMLAPPPDPMENFTRVLALVKEIKGGGLSDAAAVVTGKMDWKAALVENGPDMLEKIRLMVSETINAQLEAAKLQIMVQQGRTPPGPAPAGAAQPPAITPGAPSQPAAGFELIETEPITSAPVAATAQDLSGAPTDTWKQQNVVRLIMEGQPGGFIADWLSATDPIAAAQIAAVPFPIFAAQFKSQAIFKPVLAHPGIDALLKEFWEALRGAPEPAGAEN